MNLENKSLSIEINSFGAELTHLILKEIDQEILFQKEENIWSRQSPHLFPIVGKLINNEYMYKNKVYSLKQHGFLRDNELQLIKHSKNKVVYEFCSNQKTREVYPFDFKVWVEYRLLKNGLKIKYTVENFGDELMYYSIGAHPGFIVDMNSNSTIDVYPKKNKKMHLYSLVEGGIGGKETVEQWNLVISQETRLNDTYIFDNLRKVKLSTPSYQLVMNCEDMKYFGIWSALDKRSNQLANMVCLEPWNGLADTVDSNQQIESKLGICKLKPNEKQSCEYRIAFKIKSKESEKNDEKAI